MCVCVCACRCYSSGLCSKQAKSASCLNFLDTSARTTRLSKTLLSSTNVAINYSNVSWSAAMRGNLSALFLAHTYRPSAFVLNRTTLLYAVSMACVMGAMVVLGVWYWRGGSRTWGGGRGRVERSPSTRRPLSP